MTLDFPWRLAALLYLMAIAIYFGTGATLGFICTYLTLRPSDTMMNKDILDPRPSASPPSVRSPAVR